MLCYIILTLSGSNNNFILNLDAKRGNLQKDLIISFVHRQLDIEGQSHLLTREM